MNLIVDLDKHLLNEISQLIEQTRGKVATQANSELTILFWEVGQKINVHILNNKRAEYWTELPPKEELEKKLHSALIEAKERIDRKKAMIEDSLNQY